MNSMLRRIFVAALPLVAIGLASTARAQGNPPGTTSAALFQNVRIFDGKGASLSAPSNVLIKGNIIERISTEPIAAEPGATKIAGNGRTLMPGLIDAHWHAMLIRPNPAQAIVGDVGYNNIAASIEATDTLMRGFTTVRDVGGPVFGLKAAIDEGLIAGPRIYPSGAMITVTSGHGDFANCRNCRGPSAACPAAWSRLAAAWWPTAPMRSVFASASNLCRVPPRSS